MRRIHATVSKVTISEATELKLAWPYRDYIHMYYVPINNIVNNLLLPASLTSLYNILDREVVIISLRSQVSSIRFD